MGPENTSKVAANVPARFALAEPSMSLAEPFNVIGGTFDVIGGTLRSVEPRLKNTALDYCRDTEKK